MIQEKQENVPDSSHLAVREEADRLSALDALAVRSGLTIAKQVTLLVVSLVVCCFEPMCERIKALSRLLSCTGNCWLIRVYLFL